MLGLTGYSSSSEDEGDAQPVQKKQKIEQSSSATIKSQKATPAKNAAEKSKPSPQPESTTQGPLLGPSRPTESTPTSNSNSQTTSRTSTPPPLLPPPSSTDTQSLLRDLTLPPVPNLDIPPSPPGSPDAAATARFTHFLHIKRTANAHFNEKLAQSSSLKNPSLFEKLLQHTDLDPQAQYASTLDAGVWDPLDGLPAWGHRMELWKRREERRRLIGDIEREAQGKPLEFVRERLGRVRGDGNKFEPGLNIRKRGSNELKD